jgi:hypothetical protein
MYLKLIKMSTHQIHSTLETIATKVFACKTLPEAKNVIISYIAETKVNSKDKDSIINETNSAKSLTALQRYLCNALLKYEGLGMSQLDKSEKDKLEAEHND